MKHCRQQRAGADQVPGRDKDRVGDLVAELLDHGRHVFGAAGRHGYLIGGVGGISDADSACRRPKVAVEVVDGQNSELNRRGLSAGARGWIERHRQQQSRNSRKKRQRFHDSWAQAFLREKNALKAATASVERMRSPNR